MLQPTWQRPHKPGPYLTIPEQESMECSGEAAGAKQKSKYQASLQWQGRSNIKAASLHVRVSPRIIR